MPHKEPTPGDIENMKKALVGAGILKSIAPSGADAAMLTQELSKHGVSAPEFGGHLWCNHNFCLIVRTDSSRLPYTEYVDPLDPKKVKKVP